AARDKSEFDFILLTREWPFSFCSVTSCKHKELLQKRFNIHGLWAESKDSPSKPPMFCNSTAFNESELGPLRDELQKSWMDLLNPKGSPLYFWREEFKKHGSCVATDPRFNTTFLYFKAALQLNQKYNLSEMLQKGGVTPSSTPIDASKIRSALQSAFGFKPMVRCAKTNGQTFLYELRLCFAKDLSPNDCNEEPQPARPFTVWGVLEKTAAQLHQMLFGWSTPGSVWLPRRSNGTYECGDGELVLLPDAAQR
ncbi:hypothetical protein BOX15_Mlig024231g2, partial [Macrostomum lignano]